MAKKYSNIDLTPYEKGFQGNEATNTALTKKTNAENAVTNYGDFNFVYDRDDAWNKALDAQLNRGAFTYDLNADALYQQYKDNYINQGKMAMMDTMGQAAAMTGGYGNSYAQTVGQQTYQGHLQNLNNMIPELYQMALDRYNSEGERLAMNFDMLNTDRQNKFSEYSTTYNTNLHTLLANRDYYSTDYNNIYDREFGNWDAKRTWDTSQYWNETNFGYKSEQDAIANQLARDQLNETIRANKASEGLAWTKYNDSVKQAESDARIEAAKEGIVKRTDFDKEGTVVSRGTRGNTGNGGIKYNGKTYSSYDDYVVAMVENMQSKYGLTTAEIKALYNYYLED